MKSEMQKCFMAMLGFVVTACVQAQAPARGQTAGNITCEIKPHNGKTTMFVNGAPRFPMAYSSYYPEQYRYKQMSDHGVHTYILILTMTDKWLGGDAPVKWNTPGLWRGLDNVDMSVVEANLKKIIDVDPNALIIIRVFCDTPVWWDLLHPEETNDEGALGGKRRRQSFSSLVWRNDMSAALRQLVRGVSASKYGNHVIGYMPTAGATEEQAKGCDLSICAQKGFREWLCGRYGKDGKEIERLFGKKIDEISIPSAAERSKGDCGNFLDPKKSRLVIDLRQFHSDEIVDSGLAFCKAVKEASDGRLITGFFYGYTQIFADSGHLALRRMLDSKDVDFVTTAGGRSYTETDSVLKAGKLFYSEIDAKTSLAKWISEIRPDIDPQGHYNEKRWRGPPTIPISMQTLKEIFAKNLVSGWASWWFDLWGGWYDDEAFQKMFAQMQSAGDESIRLPRKSLAQIAVVLDENSYRYLPYGVSQRGAKFVWIIYQLQVMGTIGAPHDFYLLDDLKDLELSRYRMIVFLNAFVLSEDQRRIIRDRCMKDNRLLMWMYAPGLIKDNLSADNISSLLGMKVRMEATQPTAKIALKLPDGSMLNYGCGGVSPFFHVVEGADTAAGHLEDGRIVVAEKRGADCRNLFVSMPPLPSKAMRHYAKQAGVHIYNESAGTAVYANESYLALTLPPGRQTIRLPEKASLKELVPLEPGQSSLGKGLSFNGVETFDVECTNRTTRIFQLSK